MPGGSLNNEKTSCKAPPSKSDCSATERYFKKVGWVGGGRGAKPPSKSDHSPSQPQPNSTSIWPNPIQAPPPPRRPSLEHAKSKWCTSRRVRSIGCGFADIMASYFAMRRFFLHTSNESANTYCRLGRGSGCDASSRLRVTSCIPKKNCKACAAAWVETPWNDKCVKNYKH